MNKKSVLKKSLELFELEKIDRDIFCWNGKNVGYKRIFGGQVMAQTLIAAYKTIDVEHFAHSYHSYFLRPGNMDKSITFTVDRIRDGKALRLEVLKLYKKAKQYLIVLYHFKKEKKGLSTKLKCQMFLSQNHSKASKKLEKKFLKNLK